jgi:phage gpG-like protein
MSGIVHSFDDGPIRRHLARLALLHAKNFDKARRNIGEYMVGEIQDHFDHQTVVGGGPMPQSKAAIRRKGKTLIRHHHLYDSYVYQLTRVGLEVGSGMVYAAIHHHGGDRAINTKRGPVQPLPARPVLGTTDTDERRIGDYLIAAIAGSQ